MKSTWGGHYQICCILRTEACKRSLEYRGAVNGTLCLVFRDCVQNVSRYSLIS